MATGPSVSNQWIPEDDLLLKYAVEVGASLESLAKGAVQFSRRYTLQQLRERWYALLYDPDISAQASAYMFELEISGFNPASKLNKSDNNVGNKELSKKRKSESIRRKYYAMRKKIRSEFFSNSDLGFFEPNTQEFNGHGGDIQNCILGDNTSDHLGLQEEDLDILMRAFPETIRDIGEASGADNVPNGDNTKHRKGSIDENLGDFADPDSLLNLSNEDEILLVDVDEEKHTEENKCSSSIEDIDTTSKDIQENDGAKVEIKIDPKLNLQPEIDLPSKSITASSSEFTVGMNVPMNTEDPEVPCNDDIFLLIHPSTSFGSSATHLNINSQEKDNEHGVVLHGKDSGKGFGWAHKAGIRGMPDLKVKIENHDSRTQALLNKSIGDSSKGRSLYAIPKVCDNLSEKGVDMKIGDSSATVNEMLRSLEAGSARNAVQESVVDSSASDHDESLIDDDVPYFSDIEAMILEMDLEPYDQDSHITRQVPSYQYDQTKRTIVRLEQCARSCLQRAMTSQGALAILYGRHLRHYMRKPEVLLGRSTDDVDVDIDLRKEGRANKISRQQAIIKMEADGSFFLKNLGKSSVSVNGMTVATGQLMNLSSSCLIEIKGMSFVFEINQGYVRKHLGNFCLKNKGKKGKSDLSAEDES